MMDTHSGLSSNASDPMKCICCNSSVLSRWFSGLSFSYPSGKWDYELLQCQACGLGFIEPILPPDILSFAYGDDYCCYQLPQRENVSRIKAIIARARFAGSFRQFPEVSGMKDSFSRLCGRLVELITGRYVTYSLAAPLLLSKDARILDYGFGAGGWLVSLRKLGYKCLFGYDIEANTHASQTLSKLGIRTFSGGLDQLQECRDTFDLIRLEHVLEHHPHPGELLETVYELLSPGGVVVATLPSRDNLVTKFGGLKNSQLDIPRHLYHHTERSLRALLGSSKFSYFRLRRIPVLDEIFATWELRKVPGSRLILTCLRPFYAGFNWILGYSDFLTFVARKETGRLED